MGNFGANFKGVLARLNLTQQRAAERLGVKQATISYYCNLKENPRPQMLTFMAHRLGIPVEQLLGSGGAGMVKELAAMGYGEGKAGGKRIEAPPLAAELNLMPTKWMRQLRIRYRRSAEDADEIRVFIRRIFPKKEQAKVLAWLDQD